MELADIRAFDHNIELFVKQRLPSFPAGNHAPQRSDWRASHGPYSTLVLAR